jgi:adenine-specific DNA-methyltransferase
MFFMRKNGMKIDAFRCKILEWQCQGRISEAEQHCLLAPLIYQTCYASNTSGVFKGFHQGWGGKTGTALYRIAGDVALMPAIFCDNGVPNTVLRDDAQHVAEALSDQEVDIAYLDPPYNQHPYGSNYHVLNSVALWDKPPLTKGITGRTKSAIRMDWRTERRSAYNHSADASSAYRRLIQTLNARYILTSYSTDGTIPLEKLLSANAERGHVGIEMKGYKRYRVSSQRFSEKPMNVEFIIVLDTHSKSSATVEELQHSILSAEQSVLNDHPE